MNKGTHSSTRAEALKGRKWWLVDAADLTVGRTATRIATILKGKHKPSYTPSMDTGDFVVVVNAEKIRFTGKKETDKAYFTHTMHPGGAKFTPPAELRGRQAIRPDAVFDETKRRSSRRRARYPSERILMNAVRRMLPRTALGRAMLGKLKVYAGEKHPHAAQKPEALKLQS